MKQRYQSFTRIGRQFQSLERQVYADWTSVSFPFCQRSCLIWRIMTNTLTNTLTNTYVVIFLSVSIFGRGYHSRYQNFEFTARHEKVSPKTWRILGFADATWYLRLQVFTTDQPRCYSFDKVLYPPGFCKKNYGFLVFGTKSSRKIFSFSLVDIGTCKNNEKMFLLTGKS